MTGEANGDGDNNLACVDMSSPDLTTTAARLRQASFLPSSNYLLSFKEKKNWILVFLCCEFLGFEQLNPPEACLDCAFPPLLKSRNSRFSFLEGVCVCVCGTGICCVCASLRERRGCFFAHVCIWEVSLPPVLKHHGFHRIPVSKGILRFSSFHQLKELFSEIGDLRFGRNKNEWRSDWLRKPEFGCTVTTHVSANLMVL